MDAKAAEQGDRPLNLSGVLDRVVKETDGHEASLGEVLDVFAGRAFGPLLLVPALIAVAPTGAIPGMSIVIGTLILLIAIQILVGVRRPWMPQRLLQISFPRRKLVSAVEKSRRTVSWIDRLMSPRLEWLSEPPFVQGVAVICIALAATMYPLALVPFGVAVPGLAIAMLGLGLTAKDGALIVIGFALAAITGWLTAQNWPG
ncbi:MAG: exopolysaccharide biosynthesis protein [Inquilinaceae bacterium]